ncbi:phospholipase B1, membrane-associated-like [Otolemur garnettii]|uniref:phospholipase B1, membrane-associated-like n=1 Tax=Otolemur garnettii TaxID=30611 RepID=UPI000C7F1FD6|nr:phospholipase B1, membrane-associated-like [Otolemur garnettii]
MGLQPGTFLLGLVLLLGQGTNQSHTCPGKNMLEGQRWPELKTLKNFPFPCNPKKLGLNMPSKSVHSLKPSDIKFVAAIGNLEPPPDPELVDLEKQKWTEKRPQQTCMEAMTVLSDIIQHFNPSVLTPMCPGERAVAHHGAEDLWIQAQELVRSMKENPQLDFQLDWKLINVFFSNASQCFLCPSAQQVPKAFVNLVDLSEVAKISHWLQGTQLSPTPESCNCPEETSKLAKVIKQWSYQEAWESLLASSKFSQQEFFTVVFQPFFYEITLSPSLVNQPSSAP